MSMNRNIKRAYDSIHAPEDVIERMKQELYHKDLHGDAEHEIYRVEKAPRSQIGRYFAYIAAVFAVCAGLGMAFHKAQEYRNDFHPGSAVQQTDAVTETEDNPLALINFVGMAEDQAVELIQYYGGMYEIRYEKSDMHSGTVIAQSCDDLGKLHLTVSE